MIGRDTLTVAAALGMATLSSSVSAQQDSTYRQHLAAARASDPVSAVPHLHRALALMHGHPDVFYLLARNAVRRGQPDTAVAYLRTIAAMGLAYPADRDTTFAELGERGDFRAALAAMAANGSSVSHATPVSAMSEPDLLTEDVAYDPATRTFYISCIHAQRIIAIAASGTTTTFAVSDDTLLTPVALVVDPERHTLWATTASMPQAGHWRAADSSRSAVLRYDVATGRVTGRYPLPPDNTGHVLGDMTLDAHGNPIVSDGTGGGLYRVDRRSGTIETLVHPGTFRSPQTPAVTPDGRILVADYAMGIASVDPSTHAVTWLPHPDTVAVNGIDGMYLVGRALYAIQNGTTPERVTRFDLSPDLTRITSASVIERATPELGDPTHGVVVGRDFYFLENSGWDRFADDGHITKPNCTPARPVRTEIR
jgi:hypothetical protein